MALLIITIILIVAAAATTFYSLLYGTALAFLALCTAGLMPGVSLSLSTYIFWGIAMVVTVALCCVLPRSVATSRNGVPYIAGAALAGGFAGMALGSGAAIIIGAVAGAALGGIAYGRTPQGRSLGFPSAKFFNYLCAKGLPAAVAISMAVLAAAIVLGH